MRGSRVGKLKNSSQIEVIVVGSVQPVWGWLSELIDTDDHNLDPSLHILTLFSASITLAMVVTTMPASLRQRSARSPELSSTLAAYSTE